MTKISPSYAEGLIYYGDILTHIGRSRESLPYFDKAIRLTPNAPQLAFYRWLHAEALVHHGNFTDAEVSLVTANRMFRGKNQTLLHLLAGTQLRLGKKEEAKARLSESELLGERSISEDQAMWEFFSSDGGGELYQSMWADLKSLAASASPWHRALRCKHGASVR